MHARYSVQISTALAIGFGAVLTHALSSSDAVGYPPTAVSLGTNPVESFGGSSSASPRTMLSADGGADFVVTDVLLSMGRDSWTTCHTDVEFSLGSGTVVARFELQADSNTSYTSGSGTNQAQVSHGFRSGIRVPAGDSLVISGGGCDYVSYTLSGYHAQP